MTRIASSSVAFTAAERELIRREFGQHFSRFPSIAEGIFLRIWRGGPQAGQPKLPPAVQSLMARGLMEVRTIGRIYRAFFTEAGLEALRQLAADRRALDPIRYAHVRQELGLPPVEAVKDPVPATVASSEAVHDRLG